ncbi:MAG: hypothetical protein ACW98D_06170 [Promethearchaeota archaeon]|jgi:hypothetical protein
MVEFVKGKALIGPAVSIIGGLLWLIGAIVVFAALGPLLLFLGILATPAIIALILSIIAILGGVVAATGNKLGNYITIVIGLIGVIGLFGFIASLAWIDPILVLVGGVLGILIKE